MLTVWLFLLVKIVLRWTSSSRLILSLVKKELLTGIEVKVVRDIGKGLMGCIYVDLDKYQEARLDKLVLEVQKRMILLRKKKGAS